MSKEFVMPKLGMTMEEGTITKWLKKEGEKVEKGEPIVEIMTDKVNMEVESPYDGTLLKIIAKEGDVVPILQPIAIIGEEGEEIKVEEPRLEEKEEVKLEEEIIKASPAAKKLAREAGIDLSLIKGTGPDGRIVEKDVLAYIEAHKKVEIPSQIIPEPSIQIIQPVYREEIISSIRKEIAGRLSKSYRESVHITLEFTADVTDLVKIRERLKEKASSKNLPVPTFNDIFVRLVSIVLKDYPNLNAHFDGEKITIFNTVNMGVAVAVKEGLLVPVIKEAEKKNIFEIAKITSDLVARTREGKILPDELSGGTFTITNLGMFGIDFFTPIINPPQVAILGIGRIKEALKPGNMVVNEVTLSLSVDHRVVDGAPAAMFLRDLGEALKDPVSYLF
ncbi:MAG: 2-oxo acid dehydrogenase subunit E2 [bacterium]|nr:2-oxo acid dehydrogenase subunit E2 [bacterium]